MSVETIKKQLLALVDILNSEAGYERLKFNQQVKVKGNMSLYGCNGRIYVQPSAVGYDVSLSGISVEKELYPVFKTIFDCDCRGYKQTNRNTGNITQPYWRTDSFGLVEKAIREYNKTVA